MSGTGFDDPGLYDAMYGDVTADIAPLVALMRTANGPVLELCCGSGRVLVPALEAGIPIEGLDLSPGMLAGLRGKLAARGLRAEVHDADMRTFSLPRRYALVLIAFNSFLHNLTQADQLATLRRCREHLAPRGRLAMAVFHPSLEKLLEYTRGELLVKDIPNANGPGRVRLIDFAQDERIEQVRRVRRRVEFVEDDTVVRSERADFTLRYVFKPEMELLLRVAGFSGWSATLAVPDPSGAGRPLQEGDTLLWTAWQDD